MTERQAKSTTLKSKLMRAEFGIGISEAAKILRTSGKWQPNGSSWGNDHLLYLFFKQESPTGHMGTMCSITVP